VSPNIDLVKNSDIETNKGVLVNRFLETNIPNIYAIGDCAEQHEAIGSRGPIEAVWYTGRMMGETIAQTICGNRIEYKPGHWFNSAKFFDIEYQTYGWVWAQPKDNEARFYWEHESDKKCIHISYDKTTREFIGINTFGIRMRHEFFDKVLTEKKIVEYVLEHLVDANFDPEFYKLHEKDIVAKFNKENNTNIQLKKKSWKRIFQTN
jgi:NADPH-dependent 2,4-dienoyl-CoA reductase/sulfur reductase-like enzyme